VDLVTFKRWQKDIGWLSSKGDLSGRWECGEGLSEIAKKSQQKEKSPENPFDPGNLVQRTVEEKDSLSSISEYQEKSDLWVKGSAKAVG